MGNPNTTHTDDENYDDNEADLIPGDNSLPSQDSQPGTKNCPDNLTHIPPAALPRSKDLGGSSD
jgi:hypothetical protein